MTGFWQMTNRAATGNATATQSAGSTAAAGGLQIRLRSLAISTGAVALAAQVQDGASVIWQMDLPAAGALLSLPNLDIRATAGNNLTVLVSGTNTTVPTDVNAQGDFVPIGYPAYGP